MGFALSDIELKSTAFAPHEKIPAKYTGEGDDVSPELSWSAVPSGTKSFAVICHDPDAPLVKPGEYGFTHWVLYNIPGTTTKLEEGTREGTPGRNDFGKTGYGGPMPPEGHGKHHYYFWILALDKDLGLEHGLTQAQLLEKAEPHILGMNRLIGTCARG